MALALCTACAGTSSVRVRNDIGDITSDYNHGSELHHWQPITGNDWKAELADARPVELLGASLGLLPRLPPDFEHQRALHWRVGQLMFVPQNISTATPNPRDRPYAGWLFAGLAVETLALDPDDVRRRDQRARVELNVGIVGPSSLSDAVQTQWHAFWDLPEPLGWDSQLRDEPTLLIAAQRDLRLAYGELGREHAWDLAGHLDWNLGNLRTSANLGAVARLGKQLPRDFGYRSRPDPNVGAGGGSLFVFGDVHAVARDLFLDGNTWKSGPSVDKEPFVGELGLGVDFNIDQVQLRLGHMWRSEEITTQAGTNGVWFMELVL